jgi:hypothetical protein
MIDYKMFLGCLSAMAAMLTAMTLYAAAPSGYLVKDGQPMARICLPAGAGKPVILAGDELRNYIKKMSGAELAVGTNHTPGTAGGSIVLEVRPGIFSPLDASDQSFTIAENGANEVRISGNSELAVLYGVYQFLHELGVRWFTPGEIGENVPLLTEIRIGKRAQDYRPSFRTRNMDFSGLWNYHFDDADKEKVTRVHEEYDLWLLRNRLQFWRSIHERNEHHFAFNWVREAIGENIRKMALRGADLSKEPERFALVTKEGKQERRDKGYGVQICFTHPKNVETAIESAVAFLTNGPGREWIACPLGLEDSPGFCECEKCRKAAGAPPYEKDRLVWQFMNKVARGLNVKLPGKKICLAAPYFELNRPPADVKIEPNILAVAGRCVGWSAEEEDRNYYPFTKKQKENIETTRAAGAEMGSYDYIMWNGTPQPLNILDAARAYRAMGNQLYTVEVMQRSEEIYPILWSLAQYVWDSGHDPRELLNNYCAGYYGAAGPQVLSVLQLIDTSSRKLPRISYGGLSDTQAIMSEDVIGEGRKNIAQAAAKVTGREGQRLARFKDTFEMYARQAQTMRAYCHALNARTPSAIADACKKMDEFETFWQTNKLSDTCSPDILKGIGNLRKNRITAKAEPKGRAALADREAWLKELYAFDKAPAQIPNLYPLPEVWRLRIDYEDIGLKEGWQKPDYDDGKGWQPISTWDFFENQGYADVDGRFWYRVTFNAPRFPAGKKVYLRIGSLDDDGDIYVNGELAYVRKHNFTDAWQSSFAFEVTPFIRPEGKNTIAVRGYDGFGAGGIWRPCAIYTD